MAGFGVYLKLVVCENHFPINRNRLFWFATKNHETE